MESLKNLRDRATSLFKPEKGTQNSKRLKRLVALNEDGEEEENQDPEVVIASSKSHTTQSKKSSILKDSHKSKKNKSSVVSQGSLEEEPESGNDRTAEPIKIVVENELRPVRTAKTKATSNLVRKISLISISHILIICLISPTERSTTEREDEKRSKRVCCGQS